MKVKHTEKKGKGVFAKKRYAKGDLILCHEILVAPRTEWKKIENTFLNSYMFLVEGVYFIALGQGSLINHSGKPNLRYKFRKKAQQIEFYTKRKIKKGDELTIDYQWDHYPWEQN